MYRREFCPSAQLAEPYVLAAVNVIAADADEDAQDQLVRVRRSRVARFIGRGQHLTDEQADAILVSPQGRQLAEMMHYTAAGTPTPVKEYLDGFAELADADEVIVALSGPTLTTRLCALDLVADVAMLGVTDDRR